MIGILTFYWADDYGALLQSYGIKTYLNKYQETVMIPYYPMALRSRYRFIQVDEKDFFLRRIYRITRQIAGEMWHQRFYGNLKTKCKISSFRKKYLVSSSKRLQDSREIYEFNKNIDTYVVGSDQVWNPEITEGLQEGYFCTFRKWRKENSRYVSYGASIGTERLEERFDQPVSALLANFDAISLREPSAVSYIKNLWARSPEVVLDPVFLLNREEWETLIKSKKKRKRKYIAVYYTEYNLRMAEYLRQLEAYTGLNVLIVNPKIRNVCWTKNQKHAKGCGPLDFLALLYDAEYVVTNSFHGVSMCIIFHKQFAVFPHSSRDVRLSDILHSVHLETRIAGEGEKPDRINDKIDWVKVDEALVEAVKHSKEFIENEICKVPVNSV